MWLKIKPYVLIFPSVAVVFTLFFGGIIFGIIQSLGLMNIMGHSKFTFDFYKQLIISEDFIRSLCLTFKTSIISTMLSGIYAMIIIAVLFIMGDNKFSSVCKRIFQLPVFFPHITAAYLISILFMKSGWISSIAYSFGIIKSMQQFPSIINDINSFGIILTYVWKETPFIILMIYPVIYRIKDSWLAVAQGLGANRFSFFKEIMFPIVLPTWLSSMLIVFAFTFSDFEVPYILGVTYPKFVSVLSYQIYYNGQLADRPLALAANFILAVITGVLGIVAYRISKKYDIEKAIRW